MYRENVKKEQDLILFFFSYKDIMLDLKRWKTSV